MVSCCGLFLSFFLGIAIDSTLLSQPKNNYGPRSISDHLYSISSVETIVDSRFKLLAADFQDQIDYLKGKFVKESKTTNKGVFESQRRHQLKKRQTKTSKLSKFANNANSSCTFFYPDYPDAGLEKSKNITFKMLKVAGKEVIQKQENKTKSIKPLCEHSAPFCTFNYPDNLRAGRMNGNNRTNVTNNKTPSNSTEVNKTATAFKDLLWEEINALKINNSDQSKRIDQLEQKLAMLQNSTPPASSALTRGNNKDRIKNETSNKNSQVSPALAPPSSCQDLAMLEYYLDGLYLVKNKKTKKIQTVFCKFSADNQVSQEFTGHLEVKTKTVHFYAQKGSNFATTAVMPFKFAKLNEGNAFELASGTFTAPVSGIYHFQFSGVKESVYTSLAVYLQLNGSHVGLANASPGKRGSYDTASLSASLRLKTGDEVRLFNAPGSVLHDHVGEHWTHFSGWLVEEDLM